MKAKTARVLPWIALVLVAALAWLTWALPDPVRAVPVERSPAVDPAPSRVSSRFEPIVRSEAGPRSACTLHVVDADSGRSVPDASIDLAQSLKAGYSGTELEQVAVSGPDGLAVIPDSCWPSPSASICLVARHVDYLPSGLELAKGNDRVEIRMRRASIIAVRVETTTGSPVANARVIAYEASADANLLWNGAGAYGVSLFAEQARCTEGRTDASGSVALRVPPVTFHLACYPQHGFMASRPPVVDASATPRASVVIRVGDLRATVLEVEPMVGAGVLAYAISSVPGGPWVPASNVFASMAARLAETELRRSHPRGLVTVWALEYVGNQPVADDPKVSIEVMVDGVGWRRQRVELALLSEMVTHRMRVDMAPSEPLGRVLVTYDGCLSPNELLEFVGLRLGKDARAAIPYELPIGTEVGVPVGSLVVADRLASNPLQTLRVEPNQMTTVAIRDDMLGCCARVSVRVRGVVPHGCRLTLSPTDASGRQPVTIRARIFERVPALVPPGRYDATVTVGGSTWTRKDLVFGAGKRDLELEL